MIISNKFIRSFSSISASVLALTISLSSSAESLSPNTNLTTVELQLIAAAHSAPAPQFHGAFVVGIQPGTPFLHSLSATGERPMRFSARKLPRGLALDPDTGIITGTLTKPGSYPVQVRAANRLGTAQAELRIVCGSQLALTPPMGWNSYDAYGDSVTEAETLTNALWLQDHLQPFGWDTVVVDFRWYDSKADGLRVQDPEGVCIDANGRCIPAPNRFPSSANGAGFKPLADRLHAMGLKFGIHIMRGIPRLAVQGNLPIANSTFTAAQAVTPETDVNRTCVWNHDMFGVEADTPAGRAWYASLAAQYAAWGVDYIKCDDISDLQRGKGYGVAEVEALSKSLRASGRSIILSLSPGPAAVNCGPHLVQYANLWRISGDFWDNWGALNRNFDLFSGWLADSGPGHWPDGDMIPFGHICERNCDVRPGRWTRFTRDEQLTLMTLWALAPSPLMLGMNLNDNDDWTTALLTNPDVLQVNQDPLGQPARRRIGNHTPVELWSKPLADGSQAIGLFNRSDKPADFKILWRHLGFEEPPQATDLWLRQAIPGAPVLETPLRPHGCRLFKVRAARQDGPV
jgi:hypothetical protein